MIAVIQTTIDIMRPCANRTGGWRRGTGLVCLILAASIVLPAQESGSLPNAITFATIPDFSTTDAYGPLSALVQGTDGKLYGATNFGGTQGMGTVYKMSPSGSLTTLYNFCVQTNCTDGSYPNYLVLGTDGNFYGTTTYGGTSATFPGGGYGTAFKLTPGGTLSTLYNFCSVTNCKDGEYPNGLLRGTDGNFYGATGAGGKIGSSACRGYGCGTIFKMTPQGSFTTLHGCGYFGTTANCL